MRYHFQILFSSLTILGCGQSELEFREIKSKEESIFSDTNTSHIDPIYTMHQDIDTFYLKDVNSDRKPDTAIVFSPVHAYPNPDGSTEGGCEDDSCLTRVVFSFTDVELFHSSALGFQSFFSTGDLNSDGISEFAFVPYWFQSCWQGLFVYSMKQDSWNKIGSGSVYVCADEDFSNRIKKIDDHSFKMISAEFSDEAGGLVDTTKIIKW